MTKEIRILLAPVATENEENGLENYTNCIHQKDDVISHWHQELTDYVISSLP